EGKKVVKHRGEQERAAADELALVERDRDFAAAAEPAHDAVVVAADDLARRDVLDRADLLIRGPLVGGAVETQDALERVHVLGVVAEREVVERQVRDERPERLAAEGRRNGLRRLL